jgi:plastocyanin
VSLPPRAPLVAALLALAACGGSGERARPTPSPLERATLDGILVTLHGRERVAGRTASVEAMDSFFVPTVLVGPPGARILVVFRNGGLLLHNATVPAEGVSLELAPGSIREATLTVPAAGRLVFFCRFHRSIGMLGALEPG